MNHFVQATGNLPQILLLMVAAPGVCFLLLGLAWLLGVRLRERLLTRLTAALFLTLTVAGAVLTWRMFQARTPVVHWSAGAWFGVGNYEFPLDLVADHLSLPFLGLTTFLAGIVGVFSARYMHREGGFVRFFLLLHLFAFGSMVIFAAGSLDLIIAGWELVGITSVLLVAFFFERRDPVRSAIHIFSVYKIGDLGLVLGAFVLHYAAGTSDSSRVFPGNWPDERVMLSPAATTIAGLLLLFAAAAKSAQVPFFGWLPRAMEGPTPSSAIFYGALSVHAGAYLLLRVEPLWRASLVAEIAVVAVGLTSALIGTLAHRVAADAKTAIAYAAMTQLGIIFIEIGLGFPMLALLHCMGHAAVRTLQFLRAPSMLHDYHRVHAAAGGELSATGGQYQALIPERVQLWAYRLALDRGFYDAVVGRFIESPLLGLSRLIMRLTPGVSPDAGDGPAAATGAGESHVAEERPA